MNGCGNEMGALIPIELCEGLRQLKGEHPPLLAQLEVLYSLSTKVAHEIEVEDSFNLLKVLTAVFIEDLEPHSKREEGVLFEMMGHYIGHSMGPLAVMEFEHDRAKTLIGTFLERTGEEKPYSVLEMQELANIIKEAYYTLTEHFMKEENVLFPMAERMLTLEEKAELNSRIKAI